MKTNIQRGSQNLFRQIVLSNINGKLKVRCESCSEEYFSTQDSFHDATCPACGKKKG